MSCGRTVESGDPRAPCRMDGSSSGNYALGLVLSEWSYRTARDPVMHRAFVHEAERVLAWCIGLRVGRTQPFA
jgi:hypothetical protein